MQASRSASTHGLCFFFHVFLVLCVERSSAQATTDPTEAKAVNTIFRKWGLTAARWNTTGDPCSGAAVDTTNFDDPSYNPAIKCDCGFKNNTICHITKLKVYAVDVVGTIPDELQYLTYLENLNIAQNYLTGPFPAFIGNFTKMQYLSFGINALSGTIPKELGNLGKLISLGMGTNKFNGSLPPELGNLINLQQWYMDSCGASGDFPSTLSNLKGMQFLWASDNNFTGMIPDFIGSWTNLTTLRFQGNSFRGPIPSSFSNLTKLIDLRIGDIVDGSSSLAFINGLTSLNSLILRNSMISDVIPSNFSQFQKLQRLDFSFNNLTGQLPQSLFNLSSLSFLFLGNNSISGSLPMQKSTSLSNIDLSYNQLSGNFPSWVSQKNLQLNLVANNFVIDSSNNSILSSGLNCLQQNKPCHHDPPIYSSFAINCGGSKSIKASDGTLYDTDDSNLTAASYYVTDEEKWAVSNVGSFADAPNANYIINSQSQFQNTLDSELFQNARLSPSSLRYYGLGLENGNYTIKLQFAEATLVDLPSWKSVGRRVFDIYIQGSPKQKNFDIRKEAGGTSLVAVVKEYVVPVTNNFLEIHFFWAGKGTCCVPTQGYYGASVSAISVSPFDFVPTVSNKPLNSGSKSSNTGLIAGIVAPITILGLLALCGFYMWRQRKRRLSKDDEEEFLSMSSRPNTFSYAELRAATGDFDPNNLLGEGGFGSVFKGKISDGRQVAVKQLSVSSHQGKRQFMTEIATISAVQHRNLVKLYGCCLEGDKRLLVYEYLENKSLDQALFGKSGVQLDWQTRFEICLGTARGLAYLHEESRVRIVHRDVKASNILLDADLNPKISDFGLAKLYDDKKTHISTRVAGTIGYLAPEYAMRGHLTEKADIFGFGVVALEILCGRSNSDPSLDEEKVYLLEWAWRLHEDRRTLEMVDPNLSSFNNDEATRIIGIALLCTQASPTLRPPMSRVVAMLTGDTEVSEVTTRPGYLTEWQLKDVSSSFMSGDFSEETATRSLNSQVSMPSNTSTAHDISHAPSSSEPLIEGR